MLDSRLMVSGTMSHSEDKSLEGQKMSTSQVLGAMMMKFDDELVESSLAKSSSQAKNSSGVEPGHYSANEPSSSDKKKVSKSGQVTPSPAPNPSITKQMMKKCKQPLKVTKDLGRWKPTDDLLLINAVLQVAEQG